MSMDLHALPVEARRAILLRLLDEFLAGDLGLPPQPVAARIPLYPPGQSPGTSAAAAECTRTPAAEQAGRSLSLRDIIENMD